MSLHTHCYMRTSCKERIYSLNRLLRGGGKGRADLDVNMAAQACLPASVCVCVLMYLYASTTWKRWHWPCISFGFWCLLKKIEKEEQVKENRDDELQTQRELRGKRTREDGSHLVTFRKRVTSDAYCSTGSFLLLHPLFCWVLAKPSPWWGWLVCCCSFVCNIFFFTSLEPSRVKSSRVASWLK